MTAVRPPSWARRAPYLGLLWLIPLLLSVPEGVSAQAQGIGGDCDVPRHGGFVMVTLTNETRMFNFKTPTIRCPGGMEVRADSAVMYESTNYSQLWGNVVFRDEDSRLTSDRAQYFSDQGRLVAQGNSVVTDLTEGSVIRGDLVTLIRAGPDRAEDYLNVSGGNPHATLYPARQPLPEVAPADTASPAPDSAMTVPDTAAVASLPAVTDSMAMQPDSGRLIPDSMARGPDSVVVIPDSAGAPGDSLAAPPDPSTPPDTLVSPLEEGPLRREPVEEGPPRREPQPDAERVPYEIDAQRFILEGSRFFRAAGSVVVIRDSLRAVADSLEYDQDEGALFLSGESRVTTAQTDLAADAIRLDIPQDEVRSALATGQAVLVGEDLRLLAPIVTLFFTEGMMERLVAQRDAVADSLAEAGVSPPPSSGRPRPSPLPPVVMELGLDTFPRRPYALAQDFLLVGDSIEVLAPDEVLEQVKAMGVARGESSGRDSLNADDTPSLIASDWLEGDTIVAFFTRRGTAAATPEEAVLEPDLEAMTADTSRSEYQLHQLLALGRGRSMYRMAPSDSAVVAAGGRFAVHYVVGDAITILLNEEGEAERMEVMGQTRGIHLEPLMREGRPGDTIAVPDTAGVAGRRGGSGLTPALPDWGPRGRGSGR